ncbi:MAG: hypothetical protein ACOC38_05735 [Promethearchaeia archaeon]
MVSLMLFLASTIMLLGLVPQPARAANIVQDEQFQLLAGKRKWYNVSLEEGAAMAGWFSIEEGEGVRFFIVDQADHHRIQNDTEPEKPYKQQDCPRDNGHEYYWNFTAPHTDQWYVYFSKALGTPYALESARVELTIRTNTDPPRARAPTVSGTVRGDMVIDASAWDDCFAIKEVELLANGTVVAEKVLQETDLGDVDIDLVWHTYEYPNGWYNVSVVAYDIRGEKGNPNFLGMVKVENGLLDNPNITHPIIGAVAAIALIGVYMLFVRKMGYLEQK